MVNMACFDPFFPQETPSDCRETSYQVEPIAERQWVNYDNGCRAILCEIEANVEGTNTFRSVVSFFRVSMRRLFKCHGGCLFRSKLSGNTDRLKDRPLSPVDEVMVFLNNMDEMTPRKNHTYLTKATMANEKGDDAYFNVFGAAAYHTGNVDFVLSAYTAAVRAAQQERKPVHAANLELCLGILYHRLGHDPEHAMRIWERLMNTYRGSKPEGYLTYALETTSVHLATHHLTHSIISGSTSLESRKCGQMLELLAAGKKLHLPNYVATKPDKDSNNTDGGVVTSSPVGMLLGSYYAFCGRQEEAMRCYKAQVKDCLWLLSDDDSRNDFDGLGRLARLLGKTGDGLWTIGIYYYIYMRYCQTPRGKEIDMEDGQTSQNHIIDDGQEDAVGPRDIRVQPEKAMICDACNAEIAADWLTIRRCCHEMLLCQTCIAQLKAGTLDVNVCHPTHGHLLIPPRPAAVKKYGYKYEGMMYIENEWMSLEDLKNRLRRKWDI